MNRFKLLLWTLASQHLAMIHPRHLAALCQAAMGLDDIVPIGDESAEAVNEEEAGVLVIPVRGTIVHHRSDAWETWGMATPTDRIVEALRMAATDDLVTGVLLDLDSGGGMAQGTPEAAEAIFRFRDVKPIIALANGTAYSAAYYLGAAASEFYVIGSGGVGSIGTLTMHEDITALLDSMGVKIEILRADESENKARFNPFESLSDEEREVVQGHLNSTNARFLADVARFRGLDPESVAEVSENGRVFMAEDAAERGLVDGIATFDEVFEMLDAEPEGDEPAGDDAGDSLSLTAPPASNKDWLSLLARTRAEGESVTTFDGFLQTVDARIAAGELPENVEIRGIEAETREAPDEDHALQGTGVRWSSRSTDLGGFVEEFAEGAFGELDDPDLRVIWQHDRRHVFGRVKPGTARFWADAEGLQYSADPPDAQWSRDAMESIRRGDVDQSSFAFVVEKKSDQRWERRDGVLVRTVLRARLIEAGPQTFPAYNDSRVAARACAAWKASQAAVAVERERLEIAG